MAPRGLANEVQILDTRSRIENLLLNSIRRTDGAGVLFGVSDQRERRVTVRSEIEDGGRSPETAR